MSRRMAGIPGILLPVSARTGDVRAAMLKYVQ